MCQLAEQRGWRVEQLYSDRMSGAKASRPGLKALMQDARRGAFDVVLVWRFDRFARSFEELVLALAEFRGLGIDSVSSQEALDSSTPMGKAMFTIVARWLNWSATSSGSGSSPAWSTQDPRRKDQAADRQTQGRIRPGPVLELRAAGQSWREIAAAALGVGVATVHRAFTTGVPKPISGCSSTSLLAPGLNPLANVTAAATGHSWTKVSIREACEFGVFTESQT